ncbi:hypothetical protein D5086_007710 [Populus alba]|uniref:Uncharacterized protein n=1 Tax=Populus alba TaxID=43335 RepID=A0ACC4CFT9_POPAL
MAGLQEFRDCLLRALIQESQLRGLLMEACAYRSGVRGAGARRCNRFCCDSRQLLQLFNAVGRISRCSGVEVMCEILRAGIRRYGRGSVCIFVFQVSRLVTGGDQLDS